MTDLRRLRELADEINHSSPKTQSALREAIQERNVTVLGTTRALPQPFFVLATQNPIELEAPTRSPRRSSTASCSACSCCRSAARRWRQFLTSRNRGQPPDRGRWVDLFHGGVPLATMRPAALVTLKVDTKSGTVTRGAPLPKKQR